MVRSIAIGIVAGMVCLAAGCGSSTTVTVKTQAPLESKAPPLYIDISKFQAGDVAVSRGESRGLFGTNRNVTVWVPAGTKLVLVPPAASQPSSEPSSQPASEPASAP